MLLIKHHSYYQRCKTKYHWRSVDALLTLIFRMWLGAWVCVFCTSRWLIRRKWTVTYKCQYFTINSSISECNHKCEIRNAEPEIGIDGSCQTLRNPCVDRYRSGFGPPRVSRSGLWTDLEPNRPVFAVQTRNAGGLPGPVANTTCGEIPYCNRRGFENGKWEDQSHSVWEDCIPYAAGYSRGSIVWFRNLLHSTVTQQPGGY